MRCLGKRPRCRSGPLSANCRQGSRRLIVYDWLVAYDSPPDTQMTADLKDIVEPGIWPLVEAANASGYETVSSCEGHAAEERPAYIEFLANYDSALRLHLALNSMSRLLRCVWQLHARFIRPDDTWVLVWTLENWGFKAYTYGEPEEEWWTANTEAGRGDVGRLVDLFKSCPHLG